MDSPSPYEKTTYLAVRMEPFEPIVEWKLGGFVYLLPPPVSDDLLPTRGP